MSIAIAISNSISIAISKAITNSMSIAITIKTTKKIITFLFIFPLWGLGGLYAQKELWGVNDGEYIQLPGFPFPGTNPNVSFSPSGNIMTLYGATQLTNPQVYCVVTPPSGCPSIINAARGTHGTARQSNMDVKNEVVTIYPNPNDGNFTIQVNSVKETATAMVTDMTGKQLGTYNLIKGENKIKNKNLSSGTYLVILQIDGKTESKQLIIK